MAATKTGLEMTDEPTSVDLTDSPIDVTAERSLHRRGMPIVAWLVIIAITSFVVLRQREIPVAETDGGIQIADRVYEFQCKYLVGAASLADGTGKQLYDSVAVQMNTGSVLNRIRFTIVAGELMGADEAATKLIELDRAIGNRNVELTEQEESSITILKQLYSDSGSRVAQDTKLTPEQKSRLIDDLGWFGSLAITPEDSPDTIARSALLAPARTTMIAILCMMATAFLLLVGGVISFVILTILTCTGRLQSVHGNASPFGSVYVETFAIWMVLHLSFGLLASFVVTESNALVVSAVALMLTGVAALWPVVRGTSWKQVRTEIGLKRGTTNSIVEIIYGVLGYVAMLPFLLLNVMVLVLVLQSMNQTTADDFAAPEIPSHPIIQWATDGGLFAKLMIVFLASVVAPVLEETMFRGFLYRHLRDASENWGRSISIGVSALLSSFVFAIVHPQGWIAVPTLTTLAVGFCLLREWRGSLIASMTAHSLHNGLVTVMMLVVLNM